MFVADQPPRKIILLFNQTMHLRAECVQIEWLRQHVHTLVEKVDAQPSVLGVAGDEKHLEIGASGSRNFGKLPAVNVRQHHVGHHQVDLLI